MTLWTAVLVASIICVALKTLGYLIPPRFWRELNQRLVARNRNPT